MPTPYLEKLSKEKDIPISKLEDYWNQAIKVTEDKFDMKEEKFGSDQWAYTTGVLKNMVSDQSMIGSDPNGTDKVDMSGVEVMDITPDDSFESII